MWMILHVSFHRPVRALDHWFLDKLLRDMESITSLLMDLSDYLSGPHCSVKYVTPIADSHPGSNMGCHSNSHTDSHPGSKPNVDHISRPDLHPVSHPGSGINSHIVNQDWGLPLNILPAIVVLTYSMQF